METKLCEFCFGDYTDSIDDRKLKLISLKKGKSDEHFDNINNFIEENERQEELMEMGLKNVAMERPTKRKHGDKTTLMEKENQTRALLKAVEVLEAVQQQRMKKETLSEFAVFADYIVKQLQELPLREAIRLQLEIQTLITNTRLSLL